MEPIGSVVGRVGGLDNGVLEVEWKSMEELTK